MLLELITDRLPIGTHPDRKREEEKAATDDRRNDAASAVVDALDGFIVILKKDMEDYETNPDTDIVNDEAQTLANMIEAFGQASRVTNRGAFNRKHGFAERMKIFEEESIEPQRQQKH